MDAAEHFDWAKTRALAELDAGDDGATAMASMISDLYKHKDTERILTSDLQGLFMMEVMLGGAAGARRFIEGLPRPAVKA
jgi:hypothetical protein